MKESNIFMICLTIAFVILIICMTVYKYKQIELDQNYKITMYELTHKTGR
jgi:hypothetical protein